MSIRGQREGLRGDHERTGSMQAESTGSHLL